MEQKKTNEAVVIEDEAQEMAPTAVNKVIVKSLFLSAQESKNTHKIGVTVLLYDTIDEKGQVRVSMDQKSVKGQNVTVSPVISAWFDPDPEKTDPEVFAKVKELLTRGGLSDLYVVISGNGEFRKIHNFLSKSEFDMYLKLVG